MLDISVGKYDDDKVHTIAISNGWFFWVRMHDVHEELILGVNYDLNYII